MRISLDEVNTPEKRELFFDCVIDMGLESWPVLTDYHAALAAKLAESGFDNDSAITEASECVLRGLAAVVPKKPRSLDTIDALDRMLRVSRGIDERDFPTTHPEPLVAAFYRILQPHLKRKMQDRADGWIIDRQPPPDDFNLDDDIDPDPDDTLPWV